MRVLAIDPATNCGVAIADTSFVAPMWAVWDLSTRRDESTGMKLLRLESKLVEIFDNGGLGLIVFEAARFAAPKMQGALVHQAKLQAIIERFAERKGIPSRGYSATELKKFVLGGRGSKEDVIAAARKRWGYDGDDDNEADALGLLMLALHEYGPALKERSS